MSKYQHVKKSEKETIILHYQDPNYLFSFPLKRNTARLTFLVGAFKIKEPDYYTRFFVLL